MSIKYGKEYVVTSYYDGIPSTPKKEAEVSIISSKEMILKDIIDALMLINSGETHKLNLEIVVNAKGSYRLVKRWSVK